MTKPENLMEVPSAVKDEVRYLLESEGGEMVCIGHYQDQEVWQYCSPEEKDTGYPVVVLYHRGADIACEVPATDSLDIIAETISESEE